MIRECKESNKEDSKPKLKIHICTRWSKNFLEVPCSLLFIRRNRNVNVLLRNIIKIAIQSLDFIPLG